MVPLGMELARYKMSLFSLFLTVFNIKDLLTLEFDLVNIVKIVMLKWSPVKT